MQKLYVGNLSFRMADQDLQDLFAQKGEVLSAKIIMDRDSGRSKGFGFVEMGSQEAAEACIEAFNGQEVEGRTLRVNVAMDKPRNDRGSSRY
jgi:RNA recognition motif-containing protein